MARPSGLHEWAPRWWRGELGASGAALDLLLWPAEALFRAAVGARAAGYERGLLRSHAAEVPVLSVGNLAVGGAGKTPVAAWLARRLQEWGKRPAIVLRGYGADEVLVHGELNPTIPVLAEPRRTEGAARAVAGGADVVVLDDGFQHRRLRRDLDLVLIAAESWSHPVRLLPRGPWREPPGALRRAAAVLVTRKSADADRAAAVAAELRRIAPDAVLAVAHLAPTTLHGLHGGAVKPLEELSGRRVTAVASLADPRPFALQLERCGAAVELVAFPDHHDFTPAEAAELLRRAGASALVMTRKEAVKLRSLLPDGCDAWVLEQEVRIESGAAALERVLRSAAAA